MRIYSSIGPREIGKSFYDGIIQQHKNETFSNVSLVCSLERNGEVSNGISVMCDDNPCCDINDINSPFPYRYGTGFKY